MVSSEFSGVRCEAFIRNASSGAIKIWLDSKLIPGTAAEVTFAPGFRESGTILYCKREGKGFSAGISFQPPDSNRREERMDFSQPCVLLRLGADEARPLPSRAVNISRSGLGLVTTSPLPVGALVSVTLENFILIGEVRHCAPADRNSFRIGLSIEHQTPRTSEPEERPSPGASRSHEWASRLSRGVARFFGVGLN